MVRTDPADPAAPADLADPAAPVDPVGLAPAGRADLAAPAEPMVTEDLGSYLPDPADTTSAGLNGVVRRVSRLAIR